MSSFSNSTPSLSTSQFNVAQGSMHGSGAEEELQNDQYITELIEAVDFREQDMEVLGNSWRCSLAQLSNVNNTATN